MGSKMTKYATHWFRKAEEDLLVIRVLLPKKGTANAVCFHAQQAAEKYLKGFLAFHGKNVRKIHELDALLLLCAEVNASFNELKKDAIFLNHFYTEARYPGDIPDFSSSQAQDAAVSADRVKAFVRVVVKSQNPAEPGFG